MAQLTPSGASLQSAPAAFIHTDHLQTPQVATDSQGKVVWQGQAEVFGRTQTQGSLPMPWRFPGQYADAETNLHYNGFRTYNPQIGRYLERDPLGLAAGVNVYGYVDQNPTRWSDPDGLCVGPLVFGCVWVATNAYWITPLAVGIIEAIAGLPAPTAAPIAVESFAARRVGAKMAQMCEAGAAEGEVTVYRVFGGDARAQGFSWTTKDPRNISNFRDAAGLPSGGSSGATNTADFLIQGRAKSADVINSRSALPLDGNKGGLPELIVDPKNIRITDFSVLKP